MTSRLAMRSALASASIPATTRLPPVSSVGDSGSASSSARGRDRCQASNDSRISATERDDVLSCLLARRSKGKCSRRGELMTSSGRTVSGMMSEVISGKCRDYAARGACGCHDPKSVPSVLCRGRGITHWECTSVNEQIMTKLRDGNRINSPATDQRAAHGVGLRTH